jgi:GWxTD domain-containing protein
MSFRTSSRLAVILLSLVFALPIAAQPQKQKPGDQDPTEKPRNVKPELKRAYKDWLDKDVTYIITDEERKAFKKLETDEEREHFIEEFWRRRDPDPDTDENEYREEYYERIAYANEHYASGIPGWKSDRGRIYIMYGKPDELETHPSGGSYERESYEGGGSTSTYPFERWFYRYLPGIGSGIEIEFVDPTGSGEYRIARSPDEKDALLNIPGAGLTLAEQMGLSDKADRVANLHGIGNPNYTREQDSPFNRLQLMADLSRPPQIKFNDLASAVNTPVIEDNPLNFDVRVDFFRQSDDRVITAFTIQTDNNNLVFQDSGGLLQAQLNIFGKITHISGRRAGVFEDPVITRATPEELSDAKERKSAYQKAIALAPGNYKLDVIVRDIASGATGVRHVGFEVKKYDPAKLATSTLVLAVKLEGLGDQPAVGMFTIGNLKVIPNVSGTYHRGSPIGIYMQIYNAGIDQTTLRPSVDVDYVLLKDGKEIGKEAEDWHGSSDAGQRLTLARMLDSRQLNPGKYSIEVRVRDRVSGQELKQSAEFTVLQ